ncbi:hypothetical protein ARMGADRAFT_1089579 [Armillaria gallica]|uniref:Uncharacterized protein n=1 Tax=Armillaria gallica TaxID=47427 RepID=A0A2H3D6X7_ARMGA|nr:hypothetical protein ARMGADRAFT_1089579 [Armillaria gallica]
MSDMGDTPQFGEEIVASLKSIVQDFCDGKRTESQTLTLLYGTVGEAAVKLHLGPEMAEPLSCPYVQQVLTHIKQTKMAAERGKPMKGDPSEDEGDTEKQCKQATTSSESSMDSGSDSNKPQSSYAWHFPSLMGAKPTLRPEVIEICHLIQVYGKNIKKAKQDLRMSVDCPSLPEKLWTAILQDDAVDFDKIFASINSATIDKVITVEIGEGVSITLDSTKSSNKITEHGHWVIAWQAYTKAVLFAFPSRGCELNAYMQHVNKLFSVCHSSLHY